MDAASNILERKLHQGGVARSPLPDAEVIGQTFARQIEENLRPLVKTVVSAMVLECRIVKVADAVQDVPVPAMLGLVDVEHASIQGLQILDTDLVYHFVDLMLDGDASVAPIPITRSFTDVDNALCRLPMEAVNRSFVKALSVSSGKPMEKKVTIVDIRQDITQTRFAPDYVDVLMFNIALDIGEAARAGMLQLLLPLATLDVIYAAMQAESVVSAPNPQDLWKKQMRIAAANAPVIIDSVLHRKKLTIAEIQSFRPGHFIEIPSGATESVSLSLSHPGGKVSSVAMGRLGAFEGNKVIKLSSSVDPRIRDQIRRSI